MEPISYLMVGAVLAVAVIGVVGFLVVGRIERAMNDKKS